MYYRNLIYLSYVRLKHVKDPISSGIVFLSLFFSNKYLYLVEYFGNCFKTVNFIFHGEFSCFNFV